MTKIIHAHFGKDGGAEKFFVHLVKALASRGAQQTCFIRPNRLWREDIAPCADLIEGNFRSVSLTRYLVPWRMRRATERVRPDALLAWMPPACKLLPEEVSCPRLARLGDYPLHLNRFRHVDTLICNTPGIAQKVKELGWDRGLEVITNFTDLSRAAPVSRADYGAQEEDFIITTMGRFVPRKGIDTIIKALRYTPRAKLWIMGDGDKEKELRALTAESGLEGRVKFLGWQKDPRPLIAASNVFAMGSTHEPLGNVVLEAWAQGVPVVSTKSEGPMWFMQNEGNGLMVEIGDAEGFAKAFERLEADQQLAGKLAEGGHAKLNSDFSEDAVCRQYLSLMSA